MRLDLFKNAQGSINDCLLCEKLSSRVVCDDCLIGKVAGLNEEHNWYVYHLKNIDDKIVYVGMSNNPYSRFIQHLSVGNKPGSIKMDVVAGYENKEEAAGKEREDTYKYAPEFNIQNQPTVSNQLVKISHSDLDIIIDDYSADFHIRLLMLSWRKRNKDKAVFSPGEISKAIQTLSKKTGNIEDASKWTTNRAIKKLVEMQILNARSTSRCLWFMPNIIERGN